MTISVITINRNNRAGLLRSLDSVAQQTSRPFEYIVIDGASDDGSRELAQSRQDVVTFLSSEKDEGIYDAMNKGLAHCTGDYVYFLNSGDAFSHAKVLEQLSNRKPEADLIYGNMIWQSNGEKMVPPPVIDIPLFVLGTLWHPCVFVRREVFSRCGGFDKSFRITGDYEFLLRVLIRYGISYKYYDIDISLFDTGGVSNNPALAEQEKKERQRSWELNFSEPVRQVFFDYVKLLRSGELKWGKKITRFFR